MEIIDKVFKPLLWIATALWLVLAAFHILSVDQLLVYVGVLSLLMGVRNLLILNISAKTGKWHEKIQFYVDRYGKRDGLLRYAIVLVGLYLVLGLLLIVLNI